MISIQVVDDHPVVREGVAALLATQNDMQVVAQSGTGAEAISIAKTLRPDIILIDLQLPDMDGSEAIEKIKVEWPEARFLVLTSYDTDDRVLHSIRAGAQGYLLKGVPTEELFQAVRTIYQGNSLLGPGIAMKLLQASNPPESSEEVAERLSRRELEILKLVADGARNKEIATGLSISERTVKFHMNLIFQKLDASSRTEAVKVAVRKGLIRL